MKRIPVVFFMSLVLFALGVSATFASENQIIEVTHTETAIATPVMEMSLEEYAENNPDYADAIITPNIRKYELAPSQTSQTAQATQKDQNKAVQLESDDNDGLSIHAIPAENLERGIIGTDDREYVWDSSAYPYSAIGYLVVHKRCGCQTTGTGFMVGSKTLLTASHCIVCSEHHKTADMIEIYFGYQPDGSYSYGYFGGTYYWYGTDFSEEYSLSRWGWDYAIVELEENVGDYTGYLGIKVRPDKELERGLFQLAGYRDGIMMYSLGTTSVYNSNVIYYDADSIPGYSGSPLFDGEYYATAIHVAELNDSTRCIACRITKDILKQVREIEA